MAQKRKPYSSELEEERKRQLRNKRRRELYHAKKKKEAEDKERNRRHRELREKARANAKIARLITTNMYLDHKLGAEAFIISMQEIDAREDYFELDHDELYEYLVEEFYEYDDLWVDHYEAQD